MCRHMHMSIHGFRVDSSRSEGGIEALQQAMRFW